MVSTLELSRHRKGFFSQGSGSTIGYNGVVKQLKLWDYVLTFIITLVFIFVFLFLLRRDDRTSFNHVLETYTWS